MKLKTTIIFLSLFAFTISLKAQSPVPANLKILIGQGHKLQERASGYNVRIADKVWSYDHPDFRKAVHLAQPGWLRFFSGTMGDAFSAATGLYDLDYALMMDHQGQYLKGYRFTEIKGPHRLIDLYHLLGEVKGKLVITINAFTESPEMTYALAKFCHDNNIEVEAWQFCNEPYFYVPHRNRYWWNNGYDYALKMKPHADEIQKFFPDAYLALNFTWDGIWDFMKEIHTYQTEHGAFWNMFSKHSYAPHVRFPGPFEQEMKRANSKIIEVTSNKAMEEIEGYTEKGVPMLITEFGVWNKPLNGIFSAIYLAEYTTRQLAHPNTYLIGSHEISNKFVPSENFDKTIEEAFKKNKKIDTKTLYTGVDITDEGRALQLVHEATNQSDYFWPVALSGVKTVEGLGGNQMEAVYAAAFRGIYTEDFMIVTNRSEVSYEFSLTHEMNGPKNYEVSYMSSSQAENQDVPIMKEVFKKGKIIIKPYSVSLIKWKHQRQIKPEATRIFKSEVDNNGVKLNWWDRGTGYSYTVQYKNEEGQVFRQRTSNSQVYIKGLEPGKSYEFEVFSEVKGQRSPGSNRIVHKIAPPESPEVFKISRRDQTFTVFWKSVPHANGYRVYLKDMKEGSITVTDVKNVFGYRFSGLPYDKDYMVTVTAYNGNGESKMEPGEKVVLKKDIPLPPRNVSAFETRDHNVYLQWVNQDTLNQHVTFNIYRGRKPYKYELIATGVKANEYTDNDVAEGENYYYSVKSLANGEECDFFPNVATVIKQDPEHTFYIESIAEKEDGYEIKVISQNFDLKKASSTGIILSDISYLNLEGEEFKSERIESASFVVTIPKNRLRKNTKYAVKAFVVLNKRKIETAPPHQNLQMN